MTDLPPQPAPAQQDRPAMPGLLDRLRMGEEQAWTTVFRQLWPIAVKAARRPITCLTAAEAEEVASESLALLVRKVRMVATVDELKALAATIAHRRAISLARAKSAAKRGPATSVYSRSGLPGGEAIAEHDEAMGEVELAEMTLLLRQALDGLDPTTQRLLREKTGDGLSYQELSAKYQMPLGTVCAKVARSLQQIRKRLETTPALMKELRNFLR